MSPFVPVLALFALAVGLVAAAYGVSRVVSGPAMAVGPFLAGYAVTNLGAFAVVAAHPGDQLPDYALGTAYACGATTLLLGVGGGVVRAALNRSPGVSWVCGRGCARRGRA